VRAARQVIAERGIEHLSLRDVARRLGVSHQAPYKHFESRDHLLAEVIRRCFQHFARYLDERPRHESPEADLASLGQRYLRYAQRHRLEYRLMFGTTWPEPAVHPALVLDAVHAFDILRSVLRRLHEAAPAQRKQVDLDALFIWSTLHGLSSIAQSDVMAHLRLGPGVVAGTPAHVMQRLSLSLRVRKQKFDVRTRDWYDSTQASFGQKGPREP
jgi:AcrR family transcriptional regulator